LGELLPGLDKKRRYFVPIRIELFKKMHEWIKSFSDKPLVYLCMESDDVWQRALGWSPGSSARLKKMLDDRVR
jgi:spore photoproduct lyase